MSFILFVIELLFYNRTPTHFNSISLLLSTRHSYHKEEEDLGENTNHRTMSCYHLLLIFQVNAPYMSISMLEQSLQGKNSN